MLCVGRYSVRTVSSRNIGEGPHSRKDIQKSKKYQNKRRFFPTESVVLSGISFPILFGRSRYFRTLTRQHGVEQKKGEEGEGEGVRGEEELMRDTFPDHFFGVFLKLALRQH